MAKKSLNVEFGKNLKIEKKYQLQMRPPMPAFEPRPLGPKQYAQDLNVRIQKDEKRMIKQHKMLHPEEWKNERNKVIADKQRQAAHMKNWKESQARLEAEKARLAGTNISDGMPANKHKPIMGNEGDWFTKQAAKPTPGTFGKAAAGNKVLGLGLSRHGKNIEDKKGNNEAAQFRENEFMHKEESRKSNENLRARLGRTKKAQDTLLIKKLQNKLEKRARDEETNNDARSNNGTNADKRAHIGQLDFLPNRSIQHKLNKFMKPVTKMKPGTNLLNTRPKIYVPEPLDEPELRDPNNTGVEKKIKTLNFHSKELGVKVKGLNDKHNGVTKYGPDYETGKDKNYGLNDKPYKEPKPKSFRDPKFKDPREDTVDLKNPMSQKQFPSPDTGTHGILPMKPSKKDMSQNKKILMYKAAKRPLIVPQITRMPYSITPIMSSTEKGPIKD